MEMSSVGVWLVCREMLSDTLSSLLYSYQSSADVTVGRFLNLELTSQHRSHHGLIEKSTETYESGLLKKGDRIVLYFGYTYMLTRNNFEKC